MGTNISVAPKPETSVLKTASCLPLHLSAGLLNYEEVDRSFMTADARENQQPHKSSLPLALFVICSVHALALLCGLCHRLQRKAPAKEATDSISRGPSHGALCPSRKAESPGAGQPEEAFSFSTQK